MNIEQHFAIVVKERNDAWNDCTRYKETITECEELIDELVNMLERVEKNPLRIFPEELEALIQKGKNNPCANELRHNCGDNCQHKSDCQVHNEPASRNRACDCKTQIGR